MRIIHLPVILLSFIPAIQCVKKQFIPFATPHAVIHMRPHQTIEILQEPLKKETLRWNSDSLAQIPVEGLLRVTYKNIDYFYLQMDCPAQLKCNGKKVYIPRNMTHALAAADLPFRNEFQENEDAVEAMQFVLSQQTLMNDVIAARNWFAADKKGEIPVEFDKILLTANVPPEKHTAVFGNLHYLAQSMRNVEYADQPAPEFIRAFPVYAEIAKTQGKNLNDRQKKFLNQLATAISEDYASLLKKQVEDFPFANASYAGMAAAFNKIQAPQFLKAELVAKILENSSYRIKAPTLAAITPAGATVIPGEKSDAQTEPPATKVQTKKSFKSGIIFKYDMQGQTKEVAVAEHELSAYAHERGLGFQLGKVKKDAVLLEPADESLYLKSGNKAEIAKFVKEIPDGMKVAHEFDLDLALLRLAMKYGEGALNRKNGLFEYEIDLSKGKNFWMVLAAVKQAYGVENEDTFSGPVPTRFIPYAEASDHEKGSINWYQKYEKDQKLASLGIKGKATYCQRHCEDVEVDTVCATNHDKLTVSFRPASLYATNTGDNAYGHVSKNLHANFAESASSERHSCNNLLRLARTDEKFE
jgi:hypothetical protein